MSKLIFGFDRFKENGDPLPNCEDYIFQGRKICNAGNVFLGMFQNVNLEYLKKSKREWEFLEVDTLPIDKIKSNYIYHIDVNSFALVRVIVFIGVELLLIKINGVFFKSSSSCSVLVIFFILFFLSKLSKFLKLSEIINCAELFISISILVFISIFKLRFI